jgi:pyruvate-formate lyase-activating enzyme
VSRESKTPRRHLDLKLSYACNNRCIHCVIADQRDAALAKTGKDWRGTAAVARELADAAARGFGVVTFTGGEPTMRRDLASLVAAARSLGLAVGLQTNGRLLSRPEVREPLLGRDVRFVVALHGADAAVHDAVTRAPGSFDQTTAAMRALAEAGEKVTAKVVISRLNLAALPAIPPLLASLGVRRTNLTYPHALGSARRDFAAVVPSFDEVGPPLRAALAAADAAGVDAVTEAIPPCLLDRPDRASEAGYRGLATEVRQLDQGPRDWTRDRVGEGKAKSPRCPACALEPECEGVWRETLLAFGDGALCPIVRPQS